MDVAGSIFIRTKVKDAQVLETHVFLDDGDQVIDHAGQLIVYFGIALCKSDVTNLVSKLGELFVGGNKVGLAGKLGHYSLVLLYFNKYTTVVGCPVLALCNCSKPHLLE